MIAHRLVEHRRARGDVPDVQTATMSKCRSMMPTTRSKFVLFPWPSFLIFQPPSRMESEGATGSGTICDQALLTNPCVPLSRVTRYQ
jgi:hypothetical protein